MKTLLSATRIFRFKLFPVCFLAHTRDGLFSVPSVLSLAATDRRFSGGSDSTTDRITSRRPTPRQDLSAWEEEHHLGRSLSAKSTVSKSEQEKWTETVKRWKLVNHWKDSTFHQEFSFSKPKYEFDALETIHKKSYGANILLEIRDARIPGSCHHPSFTRLAKHRKHLIVYTHADTLNIVARNYVTQWTRRAWPQADCIFMDTRDVQRSKDEVDHAFAAAYDWLLSHLDASGGINAALTVGTPNTGKSSFLLSMLRYAKATDKIPKQTKTRGKSKSLKAVDQPIGIQDVPGKTRTLTEYLIRERPRAYFLDVPGMSPPPFFFDQYPEAFYTMGACNLLVLPQSMQSNVELQTFYCEYVLYAMNRDGNFEYVHKLGLEEPVQFIQQALENLSNKFRDQLDDEALQLKRCQTFLKLFNTGNFGPVILDDLKPGKENNFITKREKSNKKDWNDDNMEKSNQQDWYDDMEDGNLKRPLFPYSHFSNP